MKKDNAKRKFSAKQLSKNGVHAKWLWTAVLCLMAALVSGIGFLSYYPINSAMKSSLLSAKVSSYYINMNTWVAERKQRLHQNMEKVKQIAVNRKDVNPDIHFEFYTALQNMKVSVPDSNATAIQQPTANNNITKLAENVIKPSAKAASDNHSVAAQSIFDAEKLQLALKNEFNQIDTQSSARNNNHYILQMGIFKNAAGAERLRASLVKSGFSVKVVKTALAGKAVYSVQVGPFITKNQAVLAQRQLQKKSVNGIVRKI